MKDALGNSWRGRPRAALKPPNSGIRQSDDDAEELIKEADPAAQGHHGGEKPDISGKNGQDHYENG